MKLSKIKLISLVAAFAAVPFVAGMFVEKASAHAGEDHSHEVAQANTDQEQEQAPEAPAASYTYVAQPGDSYSQIARKAVQTYGIDNKVNLSQAQIIYAETMLTQAAQSPFLNQGQKVTLNQATVKSWVEKAGKLTAAQQTAWQAYTVGVDFNTDNVGEARAA